MANQLVQTQHNSSAKPPPGPRGELLFGSAREISRDRLRFIREVVRYGDVVKYRVLYLTLYQINHPSGIQRVLQDNNRNYIKRVDMIPSFDMVLGHGLLTNEGEPWLKQRRLMSPIFHHRNVETFATMMTDAALEMCRAWEPRVARGETLDVAAEMMRLTMKIVTEALFGAQVPDNLERIGAAITTLLADVTFRFDRPYYPSPRFPTPHNRRFVAALHEIDKIVYGFIAARRAHPVGTNDLLNLLLNARDPEADGANDERMSDKQVRDEAITLFLAGHETTANALAWTFYLLSQHPQVEARVRQELETVVGGREPTPQDLPRLEYMRRVLDETMRLYPPAWVLNRICAEEDEVCGYRIPAQSLIAISPYAMHRHPDYWDKPDEFDPDRFLPERSAGRPRYAYFPFGGGPRQCIGKGFALMEAPLILATVLQKHRLRLAPNTRVEPEALVTLRPRGGLPMQVEGQKQ